MTQDNDEDVLPEDERHDFLLRHPHGKHQKPTFKPQDLVGKDPEKLIKMTKKGQTVMMFATVSGNPTKRETDEITQIWWAALKNALYDVQKLVCLLVKISCLSKKIVSFRYIVDDSRVLFLLQDGSQAYEVKDYLVQQDRCQEVMIDNRSFQGKGAQVRKMSYELISICSPILIRFRQSNKQRIKIYEKSLIDLFY